MVRISVHKFSSCDGCQLSLLNMGGTLVALGDAIELVHFLEAGYDNFDTPVDISFVEGSINSVEDRERLARIRENSKYLVAIGACATSGGLQALIRFHNDEERNVGIYTDAQAVAHYRNPVSLSECVHIDHEIHGCPINESSMLDCILQYVHHSVPTRNDGKVCNECKVKNHTCLMVTRKEACLGNVTQAGCGALCIGMGRTCFGCYGPAENSQPMNLSNYLRKTGFPSEEIQNRFLHIHNQRKPFQEAGENAGPEKQPV